MGFTEKVETNLSALSRLIGEDNVDDIKKQIANIVVQAVQKDFSEYQKSSYIFFPPDYIKGIAEEAFDEVEKKIKKIYKDAMLDVAERSVQKYKELVVSDLVKESDEHE